jgi:hypothetical protein
MNATTAPPSLLTHIALPVRDLDATLEFYAKYTTLANIHERHDDETGLRTAWLANERDVHAGGTARFVIVLICGKLPTKITGDIKEEYGFLRSIARWTETRSLATSVWSPIPTATTSSSRSNKTSADACRRRANLLWSDHQSKRCAWHQR